MIGSHRCNNRYVGVQLEKASVVFIGFHHEIVLPLIAQIEIRIHIEANAAHERIASLTLRKQVHQQRCCGRFPVRSRNSKNTIGTSKNP